MIDYTVWISVRNCRILPKELAEVKVRLYLAAAHSTYFIKDMIRFDM